MGLLTDKIFIEGLGDINIYIALLLMTFSALFLGGLIGFDRERKLKPAGIKTNILICIGSTLYTVISILIQRKLGNTMADVTRISAQIVTGIGFLGAGAIIQSRGGVKGLTTAATIWVVAAIGCTIGAGFLIIATIFTVTIFGVLNIINPIYNKFENEKDSKNYQIEILTKGSAKRQIKEIILAEIDAINEIHEEIINKENDLRLLNVFITIHPRKIPQIHKEIKEILKVEKTNYHMTEYTGRKKEES
ncbi:MAG: MgtC/SapB family protein [Bacteriovoracaceae bacterium]|jgi:putative Mg2+ transporter-C (MgtC) family protein|nr:MgtC/SapB family protein [Bacteriovoracaceae bacterium]